MRWRPRSKRSTKSWRHVLTTIRTVIWSWSSASPRSARNFIPSRRSIMTPISRRHCSDWVSSAKISTGRPASSAVAGACVSSWRSYSWRNRTCYCSTSLRTIWTSNQSSGWKISWSITGRRWLSSATTGHSSTISPPAQSKSPWAASTTTRWITVVICNSARNAAYNNKRRSTNNRRWLPKPGSLSNVSKGHTPKRYRYKAVSRCLKNLRYLKWMRKTHRHSAWSSRPLPAPVHIRWLSKTWQKHTATIRCSAMPTWWLNGATKSLS